MVTYAYATANPPGAGAPTGEADGEVLRVQLIYPIAAGNYSQVDLTSRVYSLSYRRGADEFAGPYRVGEMTVILRNRDYELSPWSSTLICPPGALEAGVGVISVSLQTDPETSAHCLFSGEIDEWLETIEGEGSLPMIEARVQETPVRLARKLLDRYAPISAKSHEVIDDLLTIGQWPYGAVSSISLFFGDDLMTFASSVELDGSVLDAIRVTAESASSSMFTSCDGRGILVIDDQNPQVGFPSPVWPGIPDPLYIPIGLVQLQRLPQLARDRRAVVNEAIFSVYGADPRYVASDPTSLARGPRSIRRDDLYGLPTRVERLADDIVESRKDLSYRVGRVSFDSIRRSDEVVTLVREIFPRRSVVLAYAPPGQSETVLSVSGHVRSVQLRATNLHEGRIRFVCELEVDVYDVDTAIGLRLRTAGGDTLRTADGNTIMTPVINAQLMPLQPPDYYTL